MALAAYLVLISALVRLGSSLYLPALPRMGIDLSIPAHQLAFTMTAYMAGFAIASILLGPLSDHWGRRVLIQGGLLVFLAGSACCALAQGYGLLLTGRILQAVGGSAVPVASRAMTREAFDDHQLVSVMGWIGTMTGLVPMLAPMLGGLLTQTCGWRANFYLLVAVSLAVVVFARNLAPETLAPDHRQPFQIAGTLRAYGAMIMTPDFMRPLVPVMLCFAAQGAYLVSSPFIFIHLLGLKPAVFGATCLFLVGGLMGGRFLCLRLMKWRGEFAAFITGCGLACVGGLMFIPILLAPQGWLAAMILGAATVFCLGFGTLLPIAIKAGLSAFPTRRGASSALYGCLNLGSTAAGSAVVGALLQRTMQDVIMLGLFTAALSVLVLLTGLGCRRAVQGDAGP